MTKAELRKELLAGKTLDDFFAWSHGQECYIYKAARFVPGDEIIYIPDTSLNEIPTVRPITNEEELEEVLDQCFTGDDFEDACVAVGLPKSKAEGLFCYVDWQHPSSVVDAGELDDDDDDNEVAKKRIFSVIETALARAGYAVLDGDRDSVIVRYKPSDADYQIDVRKIEGVMQDEVF